MHTSSGGGDRMIIAQISDMHLRDNGMLLKQKINTEVGHGKQAYLLGKIDKSGLEGPNYNSWFNSN